MFYFLDIIIPKREINKTSLREQFASWGNEYYSYTPQRYYSSSNLFFEKVNDLRYFSRLLKKDLDSDQYIALCLKNNAVSELDYIINNSPTELKHNDLVCFITELITLSEFYVFLLRDDEGIKRRYTVKNKTEIITSLYNSLQWTNPLDILITK